MPSSGGTLPGSLLGRRAELDLANSCLLAGFHKNDWTLVTDATLTVEKDSLAASTGSGRQGLGVWYPCGMEDDLLVGTGEEPSCPSRVRVAEVQRNCFLSLEGQ